MRPEGMSDFEFFLWGARQYWYLSIPLFWLAHALVWGAILGSINHKENRDWTWAEKAWVFLGPVALVVYAVYGIYWLNKEGYLAWIPVVCRAIRRFAKRVMIRCRILYLKADARMYGHRHVRLIKFLERELENLE